MIPTATTNTTTAFGEMYIGRMDAPFCFSTESEYYEIVENFSVIICTEFDECIILLEFQCATDTELRCPCVLDSTV